MKKRIISLGLVALMATSALYTTASAAGLKSDATLEAASTVSLPTLDVTVPTSAAFVINPYKLSVQVADTSTEETASTATVVPLYPKGKTGWEVSNNSADAAVDVYMYATYKAGKTVQVNAITEGDGKNLDETKKQLKLVLKFDSTAVKLHKRSRCLGR